MDRAEARRLGKLRIGDKIDKLADKTGIKKAVAVVERATGWKCGCAKRREWINRL